MPLPQELTVKLLYKPLKLFENKSVNCFFGDLFTGGNVQMVYASGIYSVKLKFVPKQFRSDDIDRTVIYRPCCR